jgi:hypothetical protein
MTAQHSTPSLDLLGLPASRWREARASADTGGECVELASTSGAVAVRDSKNPSAAVPAFSRDRFVAFLDTLR